MRTSRLTKPQIIAALRRQEAGEKARDNCRERRADARDFRRQATTASCLTLILACVVYWQIREIERVVVEANGDPKAPVFRLLAHVSPTQWDNLTLYGAYDRRRELVSPRAPR